MFLRRKGEVSASPFMRQQLTCTMCGQVVHACFFLRDRTSRVAIHRTGADTECPGSRQLVAECCKTETRRWTAH
jgi:hypothetical protein